MKALQYKLASCRHRFLNRSAAVLFAQNYSIGYTYMYSILLYPGNYPPPVYPLLTDIEPHLAIEVFPEQEPPPRPTVSIAVVGSRLNWGAVGPLQGFLRQEEVFAKTFETFDCRCSNPVYTWSRCQLLCKNRSVVWQIRNRAG